MADPELIFRILVGILFGVFIAIRAYFQKVHEGVVSIEVRHERRERIFYALIVTSLFPIYFYVFLPWAGLFDFSLPIWVRVVGGLFVLSGEGSLVWVHRTLGRNWSVSLQVREGHTLIVDGPYRFVRHPMYTSMLLVAAGTGLLAANLLAWSYFLALSLLCLFRFRAEEQMMRDHFGEAYDELRERTGLLLPSWRAFRRSK